MTKGSRTVPGRTSGHKTPENPAMRRSPRFQSLAVLAPLLWIVPMTGCGGEDPTAPSWAMHVLGTALPAVQVDTVISTVWSSFDERARLVIRTDEEWSEVWERIHEGVSPVPGLPDVDLSASMLVLAAMGMRPSGGYSISVRAVRRDGQDLRVWVEERSPGSNCGVPDAITAPVVVVEVPATSGEVTFVERARTISC